jgi:hypothetical protein
MNDPRPDSRLFRWVDERYGISSLIEFFQHKEVPIGAHSMVWYYLGGTTLFFFTVQILSGVLLLMYYQPGQSTSYESIRFLTTKVPFGWLVRSVHCWSAHLMILSLVVHMFSTMMLKAYRPPRELTWVTGVALFGLALGFGFSGYLLPWNELAFFATAVGTDSVKSVPVVGDWLLNVLRGGPDVTINTLYRFFALHVGILPIVTVGLMGIHLLFIQRQGMALPLTLEKNRDRFATNGHNAGDSGTCAIPTSGTVPGAGPLVEDECDVVTDEHDPRDAHSGAGEFEEVREDLTTYSEAPPRSGARRRPTRRSGVSRGRCPPRRRRRCARSTTDRSCRPVRASRTSGPA